jgi:GT2 family glycosyltransferase
MTTTLYPKVTVVTIMHGDRWKFLTQVVTAVMKDVHVTKLVIVDNGSKNQAEILNGTKQYGDKVVVLREEKNLGSAGGFGKGLEYARGTDCDFVYILDDDSVPEDGSITLFMETLRLFPDQKVVLSGNRIDLLDNKEIFYKPTILTDKARGTFFEVFSLKKLIHFLGLIISIHKKKVIKRGPFIPVIPNEAFVYGGAFIPIDAVRRAPLPDASLFLYCDDVEYSWNIKKLGYDSYLCALPRIYDVDTTFGGNTSHIFGQFDSRTGPIGVYFRMRNMIRVSRKHSKQNKLVLLFSILTWVFGLFILGLIKNGPTKTYFKRVSLLSKAVYAGYNHSAEIPLEARPL